MTVRTLEEAIIRYGAIVDGKWGDEAKWCVMVDVPAVLAGCLTNAASGHTTTHVYCNSDMAPALKAVFAELVEENLCSLLHSFNGCLMIRAVRGEPHNLSTHAYALAIDLDADTNALGAEPQMDPRIVEIFKKHGFSWGGDFRRKDGMHFSYAWECA